MNVNNHIHTTYSFSPYTPTQAAFCAREAGLCSAGIMDHDSVGGAREFLDACAKAGIAATVGMECRVSFAGTPFFDRRINNPDQKGVAYVALHGIPHTKLDEVEAFIAPRRVLRGQRNRKMVERINECLKDADISLDYENDILPLSMYKKNGSVTERHLLFAAARAMICKAGKGEALLSFLSEKVGLTLSEKQKALLGDEQNELLEYDLLGVLKSTLIDRVYIDADEECPPVEEFIEMARRVGGISAYAYLGDVGNSVTGDKKAQTFEDSYIDELFPALKKLGFQAVTYMPTRNTLSQLNRVMELCRQYGFFQISGEDINSPRQSFLCAALERPEFSHLVTSTWALIGHEVAATADKKDGLFTSAAIEAQPLLEDRVERFAKIGLSTLPENRTIS